MMPFGFDPHDAARFVDDPPPEIERIYVAVTYRHTKEGQIIPLSFTWTDGREIKIDKVLQVRKGNSLKVFSRGVRYYCETGRRRFYLHYDGEWWYVEKEGYTN